MYWALGLCNALMLFRIELANVNFVAAPFQLTNQQSHLVYLIFPSIIWNQKVVPLSICSLFKILRHDCAKIRYTVALNFERCCFQLNCIFSYIVVSYPCCTDSLKIYILQLFHTDWPQNINFPNSYTTTFATLQNLFDWETDALRVFPRNMFHKVCISSKALWETERTIWQVN